MAAILLLEPDRRLAAVYADGLRAAGHSVVVRATAQQAISAADEARPDAVVCELQLTNHSGIEFLYEFRSYADWRTVPVVVASHVPESSFAESRRLLREQLGVRGYLYKPALSLRDLQAAVGRALA